MRRSVLARALIAPLAWDRAGLTRALAGNPDAARVLASIEAYEHAWLAAKQEACEATRVRDELSERVLAARCYWANFVFEFILLTGLVALAVWPMMKGLQPWRWAATQHRMRSQSAARSLTAPSPAAPRHARPSCSPFRAAITPVPTSPATIT